MTCAGILAFVQANSATLLAMWLVVEQYLAANKRIKANSTLELVVNIVKAAIKANTSPSRSR